MLIIPFEKNLDWRRPPWMTLLLMLLCFLVFVFYQGKDPRLIQAAFEDYLAADLDVLETPVYEEYLERQIRLYGDDRSDELTLIGELREAGDRAGPAMFMLMDQGFYEYLSENRDLIWTRAERERWTRYRVPIQERLAQLSYYELGLVPAQFDLYTLITYQFLHGGWGHLIGNMVFLFLLGFTVERALGPGRYLMAYLLCGALSGAIYTLFTLGSKTPLVGASGSISGLMGMYVAFYGMQRIRFFYFILFYFSFFRAPALALLPVWLGKELFHYWTDQYSGVAYLAHAGGLVAGAVMVYLLRRSWLQVSETFYDPEEDEQDQQFARDYGRAMEALARMDFELARRQFEALRQANPGRLVLREHLYQLAKLRPDRPEFREQAVGLLHEYLRLQQAPKALALWQEYLGLAEKDHPLAPEEHSRVLFAALREDDLKVAEKAFERLRQGGAPDLVREAGRLLVEEFSKRQMGPKANEYQALLNGL